MTKEHLLARVWERVVVEENTLQAHVSALRKVLGSDAIATVPGSGYRFALAVARESASKSPIRKHNLPNQLTSFVGRENEVEHIKELFHAARLLTLTGSGGCGKTRLALRVAEELMDKFADGCWLVELAPLGDPSLVPQAIASALAVKDKAGEEILESVVAWLGARHLLLVLDNAEHLLSACAEFSDRLLKRCAGVSILTTSRERLGVAGELTYRVPRCRCLGCQTAVPANKSWRAKQRVCSLNVRVFIALTSTSQPETKQRWVRSAGGWTASPWRSSWLRRAFERCQSSNSVNASMTCSRF